MKIEETNEAHFQFTLHQLTEAISGYFYRTVWYLHSLHPEHAEHAGRHLRDIKRLATRAAGLIEPQPENKPVPSERDRLEEKLLQTLREIAEYHHDPLTALATISGLENAIVKEHRRELGITH